MKIGYKATYDYKCRDITYEVGKLYEMDDIDICKRGFHYCDIMKDVMNYYNPIEMSGDLLDHPPKNNFVLLEVEILGKVIVKDDKSVTDKMKIVRVIPWDEHKLFEIDDKNRAVSFTTPLDRKTYHFEYDERDNLIGIKSDDGKENHLEYDERDNLIGIKSDDGKEIANFKYDHNNTIKSFQKSFSLSVGGKVLEKSTIMVNYNVIDGVAHMAPYKP